MLKFKAYKIKALFFAALILQILQIKSAQAATASCSGSIGYRNEKKIRIPIFNFLPHFILKLQQ